MGNDKSFDVLPPLEREKYLPYHGQYETDKEDTTSSNILQWWSTGVETGIPTKAEKSLLESLAAWEEAKTVAKEAHKQAISDEPKPPEDHRHSSLHDWLHGRIGHRAAHETLCDAAIERQLQSTSTVEGSTAEHAATSTKEGLPSTHIKLRAVEQ